MDNGIRHIIYLIHARLKALYKTVLHAKMCRSLGAEFSFSTFLMPRTLLSAEMLYSEAGLLGDMSIRACPLYFVPLEDDLMSLEAPMAFKEVAVDGDTGCLFETALALTMLQQSYGSARYICGSGHWAKTVSEILLSMRKEAGPEAPAAGNDNGIDTILLIDRNVDMITPMCTQLTYEGLMQEILDLKYGSTRGGAIGYNQENKHGLSSPRQHEGRSSGSERKITGLNSTDPVFVETRDQFFPGARQWINETLRSIQRFRDDSMGEADIVQLKGFVSELREKFARLPLHAKLMEKLADVMSSPSFINRQRLEASLLDEQDSLSDIDDLVANGEDILHVLRLLCIYCVVFGGIAKRQFDIVRRDLLNTYGHMHLLTLRSLQKAGLLYKREQNRPKSSFSNVKEYYKLLIGEGDNIDHENPKDIHFTYAGYAPLSVRIIQDILCPLNSGSSNSSEMARAAIKGPMFSYEQFFDSKGRPQIRQLPVWNLDTKSSFFQRNLAIKRDDSTSRARKLLSSLSLSNPPYSLDREAGLKSDSEAGEDSCENTDITMPKRTVLVMFIGGATSAELAALRFINRTNALDCNFVFATTSMITGDSLLASMVSSQAQDPGI